MEQFDVVVLGAGAAGMMCAIECARRSRRVLVLDHNRAPGEKIRISGGGRCNFTNLHTDAGAFLSENPKFAISALRRYSQWDFLAKLDAAGIGWHEKTLGQLFCDDSAMRIVDMLVSDLRLAGAELRLATTVRGVERKGGGFRVGTSGGPVETGALVIATGGRSIPKMGASGFGYEIARQFGLDLVPTRAGLVPLTFAESEMARLRPLAGLSARAAVTCNGARFEEGLLFTHRGLSGPSILQVSSYWREGDLISIDLMPGQDAASCLERARREAGRQMPATALAAVLPKRLAALVAETAPTGKNLADLTQAELAELAAALNAWQLKPIGSEGYRTAEVTLGGVSTAALDPRSMEARSVPGLFFIGEVVDVTGWLGGYNFQWAWSSGWVAGQAA